MAVMATNSKEKQREYNKRRGKQSRGWAFIWYPEMFPLAMLIALLDGLHLEYFVSPLHDQDVDAEGKPKKAHRHVMVMWPTAVGAGRAHQAFSSIGVTAPPECLESCRGYARYLAHMDDHDKHRYDERDIIAGGGAVWASVALDADDATDMILDEVCDWIDENGVTSYRALCRYARTCRVEWKHDVYRHTIFLTRYMRSYEYEMTSGFVSGDAGGDEGAAVNVDGGDDGGEAQA